MNNYRQIAFKTTLVAALAVTAALPSLAIDLVQDGKPVASIVIPAQPLAVESYAAQELQYHIKASTGVELSIVSEDSAPAGAHVYLGNCRAAATAKADPSQLPGNSYVLKTTDHDLYIAGKDGGGNPLGDDVHAGTLFGVYDILENQMGIHWLWPGKLGEVIPKQKSVSLPALNATVKPLLWFKDWERRLHGSDLKDFSADDKSFSHAQAVWARRQRFGRSTQPHYGHMFYGYWAKYGKEHPEYFGMQPDGTRGPDPLNEPPYNIHMSVSSPGLRKQIIENWVANGAPEFINVCDDDGWAGCVCPECMAWDEPDPTDHINFNTRLEEATKAFKAKDGNWMLKLGSLSDRYARFWELMQEDASKIRPDVKIVTYVYDNYRKPPMKAKLNPNVLCGEVPSIDFPYNKPDSEKFREEFAAWSATGCSLYLRPNYTLQGHDFPMFYARLMGEDVKFALAHSLKGVDFDSLTGSFGTQGPTLYTLAKVLNYPNASVDGVLDEYYSAFGPAKKAVKKYFEHWESVYNSCTPQRFSEITESMHKYGIGDNWWDFYVKARFIYTPKAMDEGREILDEARKQAAGDPVASKRVEWLAKGLEEDELVLAAEQAYEHSIDTGDRTELEQSEKALADFRAANADSYISNGPWLNRYERRLWDKVWNPR